MNANAAPTTALIVIDVQQSFEHAKYWSDAELPAFRERLLALIAGAKAKGWPVVRILHAENEGPFGRASGWVTPMDWVPADVDVEFVKSVHNAFTDTGLDRWLRGCGIGRVAICGIRTEQCCETTARVASDMGYEVDFVTEATLTFAMTHPLDGRRYDSGDIKARTELVLGGRFANLRRVEEALAHA